MRADPNHSSRLRAKAWRQFSAKCPFAVNIAAATAEGHEAALLYLIAPFAAAEHSSYFPPEFPPSDQQLEHAFETARRRIELKLKRGIQEGVIPVRHLHGLDYANSASELASWCANTSHSADSEDHPPPIPFVVLKRELKPFFESIGVAMPRELMPPAQLAKLDAAEHEERQTETDRTLAKLEAEWPSAVDQAHPTPDALPRAYWLRVFTSHLNEIEKTLATGGDSIKVIQLLKRIGDPRIPNEGPMDRLIWITDMGQKKSVSKKTIQNLLSPKEQAKLRRR